MNKVDHNRLVVNLRDSLTIIKGNAQLARRSAQNGLTGISKLSSLK